MESKPRLVGFFLDAAFDFALAAVFFFAGALALGRALARGFAGDFFLRAALMFFGK